MRACLIGVICSLLLLTGCSSGGKKSKACVTKTFFDRTIEYKVDPEAMELLKKLETLLTRAHKLETTIDDELILPVYRDADMDRDRFITKAEASVFSDEFISKFEDSLGRVKMKSEKEQD